MAVRSLSGFCSYLQSDHVLGGLPPCVDRHSCGRYPGDHHCSCSRLRCACRPLGGVLRAHDALGVLFGI